MEFSRDCAASAIAGIASYICYFNRGEHHLYAARYPVVFVGLGSSVVAFLVLVQKWPFKEASLQISILFGYYLAGLYTSLILYRLLFHPLRRFPGSLGARVSAFWLPTQLQNSDAFRQLQKLHEKHGHFVRVGPADLSISHPKAVMAIYGQGSKCIKAAWYDLTAPMVSLQTLRVKALHDQRRRTWSTAFSDKALRGYEQRILVHRQRFIEKITAQKGKPINVSQWFNWYSFDVMGDLAFGKSFGMIDNSADHWAIQLLNDGIHPLSFMFPVWFFRLLTAIPGLTRDWWRFIRFCVQSLEERMKTEVGIPDISAALLVPLKGRKPDAREMELLQGDAQLIVVAGSDTTATTLSNIIYQLGRYEEHIDLLRAELAPFATGSSGEILHEKIAHLDHLNGIIYESLRLHPPVPTALQRKSPPEGIEIDGTFIPGNVTVFCPQYVIGRNEEIYPNADQFLPERWYKYPELVKERSAFAPFSTGPYGCIGRPLALLNIRTTLARLVLDFDIKYAPDEDGTNFTEKAAEHFTMNMGELKVTFTPRRK